MNIDFNSGEIDKFLKDFIEVKKKQIVDSLVKKYSEEVSKEFKASILSEASKVHIYIERTHIGTCNFIIKFEVKENNPKE